MCSPLLQFSILVSLICPKAPHWEFASGATSTAKWLACSIIHGKKHEELLDYSYISSVIKSNLWHWSSCSFAWSAEKKRLTVWSFSVYSLTCQMQGQKAVESQGNVSLWLSSDSSEGRQPAVSVNCSHLQAPSSASNCWNEQVCLWQSARRW